MGYYVGLDVSLKSTHICVLDGERRVVWRGVSDTQIAMIAEHLARWGQQIVLVGLAQDGLSQALGSPSPSRPGGRRN
jgi:transposase